MLLDINNLGGEYTCTHSDITDKGNFKKLGEHRAQAGMRLV